MNSNYTENIDQVIIQAELTPELAMELIRDLASAGTEAASIRIEMRRRYYDEDANLFLSINNGFVSTTLKVQAAGVVVSEEVTA